MKNILFVAFLDATFSFVPLNRYNLMQLYRQKKTVFLCVSIVHHHKILGCTVVSD